MRLVIDFNRGNSGGVRTAGMEVMQAPPELIAALQAAHARDHELVGLVNQLKSQVNEQNELLRTRTIERDHHAQDAHLWSCIVASLVHDEVIESLAMDDVNAMEGVMLSADVRDGRVHLSLSARPEASEEGRGG